ncbi:MAG: hypothetical protein IJQ02_04820 [Oscillospiraceae bacterium]|nr:hypothetical protein [Oscillospiraceae bacterium]
MSRDLREPLEIERKYLVHMPDVLYLESLPNCRRADIVQTYLLTEPDQTLRVRRWTEAGKSVYYRTLKRKLTNMTRIELEEEISEQEYCELLVQADPARRPITKTRYCLEYRGQLFEIDIFPFWTDQALMEIELLSEDQDIVFPPEIQIIREVTDDGGYTNAALAARY